jgi:glycosyltransferase involved in cell wall biosynthesis
MMPNAMAQAAIMSIHGLEPDLFADLEQLTPILDGVICSNRLAQTRARLCVGIDPARVRYPPYGTPSQPSRKTSPNGPLTIGFSGRFERFQKRVQDLAPIAKNLLARDIPHRWLIAGDGPDKTDIDALEQVPTLQVECLGYVPAAHMHERFYNRCDVLLNPSEWETGPIVVWEAMANGITVVSSNYVGSGCEAALRHGENCLMFPVGDIEQASRCIGKALDTGLRTRLAHAAQQLLAQRYTPATSCDSWADAISVLTTMAPATGKAPQLAAAGRLDRWFGATVAYRLRCMLDRTFDHREPGSEWPHTLNFRARDDHAHWHALTALDKTQTARTD